MLNEKAEFEAYITNPESSSPRIQPKLLTGNFSTDCGLYGIEQILVVLARGYIFDTYREDEIYSDGFVRPELLNDAKLFLQRWLGFHLTWRILRNVTRSQLPPTSFEWDRLFS